MNLTLDNLLTQFSDLDRKLEKFINQATTKADAASHRIAELEIERKDHTDQASRAARIRDRIEEFTS